MSEYFYHKGVLKFKTIDSAVQFFGGVIKLDYIDNGDIADGRHLSINGNVITIDTVGMASMSVSKYDGFTDILYKYVEDLEQPTDLETYLYGDGYGVIKLDPVLATVTYKKLSEKDPYDLDGKPSDGSSSIRRTVKDQIDVLMKDADIKATGIDRSNINTIVKLYYTVVKNVLIQNDIAETPLGDFIAMDSLVKSEGRIAAFLEHKPLGKKK